MNPAKISESPDETQAGRELDALIAEKVMGYKWVKRNPTHELNQDGVAPLHAARMLANPDMPTTDQSYFVLADGAEPLDVMWFDVPAYSTDIAHAWKVVERLRARFGSVVINCDEFTKGWAVEIAKESQHPTDFIKTDTVAIACAEEISLAICRAALIAATGESK